MSLTTDVLDLLAELGDTEHEVAASLARKGIKGVQAAECACPIFNYLASKGMHPLEVDVDTVYVRHPDAVDGQLIDLPDEIAYFITEFDAGMYPDLILAPGVSS